MKKKNLVVGCSIGLLLAAHLVILGIQFLSGGSNPADPLLFVLMMVIGGSFQTIALLSLKNPYLQLIPLVIAIGVALWGTCLYLFSESWMHASFGSLVCGYASPAVGALLSLILVKRSQVF